MGVFWVAGDAIVTVNVTSCPSVRYVRQATPVASTEEWQALGWMTARDPTTGKVYYYLSLIRISEPTRP